ncbi:MAG TPA: hypothetical protein VL403_04960 [Candidatus Kryptonia bacterium]|nr:hypothetical protein [Candidatus Kryptonia bacterium]
MYEHDTALHHEPHANGGHERRDVTFRPIVLSAIGLVALFVLVFVGMRLLFSFYAAREAAMSPQRNPLAATYGRELPPEPRLQTAPIQDLRALHAAEDATLNSYGWVDDQHTAVRIPIARAMELLAHRGLPARTTE